MNLEREKNNRPLIAHLSMFGACAGWGLMAPVGKDAMTHGIDGITMVTFRVVGACLLFWIASRFAPKEEVPMKDKLMFIGAALMGLVFNQCCYTIGLSITSPINASIVTTSMPIFAMLLSALILKEPITSLSVALQSAHQALQCIYNQQIHVLLGYADTAAFHVFPRLRNCGSAYPHEDLVGGRLCRLYRHIRLLHPHDDWSANAAPYGSFRL